MRMQIDVPDYSDETGIGVGWEPESAILVELQGGAVRLAGNQDGLVTLARLLLALSQPGVSAGSHLHLDQFNGLEDGSVEIIVEKM